MLGDSVILWQLCTVRRQNQLQRRNGLLSELFVGLSALRSAEVLVFGANIPFEGPDGAE